MTKLMRKVIVITVLISMSLSLISCNTGNITPSNKADNKQIISKVIDEVDQRILYFMKDDIDKGLDKTVSYTESGRLALDLADQEFKQGNYSNADSLYIKVFETDSAEAAQRDMLLYWAWGYANYKQGKYEEAALRLQYVGNVAKELGIYSDEVTSTLLEFANKLSKEQVLESWNHSIRGLIAYFRPEYYDNRLNLVKHGFDRITKDAFLKEYLAIMEESPKTFKNFSSEDKIDIYSKALAAMIYTETLDEKFESTIKELQKLDSENYMAGLSKAILLKHKGDIEGAKKQIKSMSPEENDRTFALYSEIITGEGGIDPDKIIEVGVKGQSGAKQTSEPLWSPDGKTIAMTSSANNNADKQSLIIIDVESGSHKEYFSWENISIAGWFNDGKRLLVSGEGIWEVNIETDQVTKITEGKNPKLSKNNKLVAFENQGIRVLNLENDELKIISQNSSDIVYLWDPFNAILVYGATELAGQSSVDNIHTITTVDINTLETTVPIKKPGTYFDVQWIIEGRILKVFEGSPEQHSSFVFRLDEITVLEIAQMLSTDMKEGTYWRNNSGGGILVEQDALAFVNVAGQRPEFFVLDGYHPYYFTKRYRNFVYSDDNLSVAFERTTLDKEAGSLWIANEDLTEFKLISKEEAIYSKIQWSPSGDKIAVIEDGYRLLIYKVK